MNDFDDLDSLLYKVQTLGMISIETDMDEEIKEVCVEENEHIYTEYEPKNGDIVSRYRQGIDGSFADKSNLESDVKIVGDFVEYEVKNERQSDCLCDYCENEDTYLDYYIENGIAGTSFIPKRPANERVIERIENEDIVKTSFRKTFNKFGIKID